MVRGAMGEAVRPWIPQEMAALVHSEGASSSLLCSKNDCVLVEARCGSPGTVPGWCGGLSSFHAGLAPPGAGSRASGLDPWGQLYAHAGGRAWQQQLCELHSEACGGTTARAGFTVLLTPCLTLGGMWGGVQGCCVSVTKTAATLCCHGASSCRPHMLV